MDSFAFWYKVKTPENGEECKTVEATMNFNLWCQCGWTNDEGLPYLDIGFKLKNLKCAEKLFFFLPFNTSQQNKTDWIEDLGCKFTQTELVDSVFNESYATTIAANKKTIRVERALNAGSERFYIYQLDVEHDLELEHFAGGTIVVIETENIYNSASNDCGDEEPVYYLRFRVKNCDLDFLIHQYTSPNHALQSLFNTTYMIDFRYHNVRSLHKTLIERFNKKDTKVVAVTSLHFLLMTKAYIDVSISHSGFKGTRKIEKGVWDEYVNGNDTEDLLAYHIAQKPKNEGEYLASSELFAKFRVEKSVLKLYICFTIALSVLGSLIWAILESGITEILKAIRVMALS